MLSFFLDESLDNDIIADFFNFRVPKTDVFSTPAVLNFQKDLLKDDVRKATANVVQLVQNDDQIRRHFSNKKDKKWLPSVVFKLRQNLSRITVTNKNNMNAKLLKLSNFQGKPLRKTGTSIKLLDDIKLPKFCCKFCSYGPKHPIKDKFNEIHLQGDFDKLVRKLHGNRMEGEHYVI